MTDPTDPTEDPLLLEIQARYVAARDHASKWREQAKEEFRFYAGDQWDEDTIAKMKEQQRPVITFNRTMRLVNAVIGHEANNRAEVRYIPRTQGDAAVNELLTQASSYFRDACDAEFEESDAFRDMIISGMGWTNDRLSDAQNPDYDLIEERVDPLEMLWDPSSKKPNLADARYLFRSKRYTEKEIRVIWPDFEGPFTTGFADEAEQAGEAVDRSPRTAYQGNGSGKDVRADVLVVEYQYKEREAYYVVASAETGESIEIPADKMEDELKAKLEASPSIKMVVKRRTVTRRCFLIGNKIVQGPDVVCPHDFTYHCITGFRDREKGHWFGIVRMLKDPQRWSNKWLAQIMHILNSNAKGGLMAEEDGIDKQEFESKWADPAAVLWVPAGTLEKKRIEQRPPPLYPQGVDRLLEYANSSFTDVSGVNQELLGLADREQPGVLEWQRKQSAVTLLAPLFDSLRRFRKMQGRCWLYMMQRYVSDGRMIRITQDAPKPEAQPPQQPGQPPQMGHNGGPPMQAPKQINVPFGGPPELQHPEWRLPGTAEYDVIVDQASTAPNQKEQTWAVLSQLFPVLKELIPPQVMLLALEYSPLPESFVQKAKEFIAQQQAQGPPPDPEMMKAQAAMEAKKAELAMRQQESAFEADLQMRQAQQDAQLKQQQAELDARLKQQQAEQELQIERYRAGQQAMIEQEKANRQAETERIKIAHQVEMDKQRADHEEAMSSRKEALAARQAEHSMGLAAEAAGMKLEVDGAKDGTGKGPFARMFDGLTDRHEKGFAAMMEHQRAGQDAITKAMQHIGEAMNRHAEVLASDSTARGAAIKEILGQRARRRGMN